jgi:hypothetical protein
MATSVQTEDAMGTAWDSFNFDDRIEITRLRAAGEFRGDFGHLTGRDASKISRETPPNSVPRGDCEPASAD